MRCQGEHRCVFKVTSLHVIGRTTLTPDPDYNIVNFEPGPDAPRFATISSEISSVQAFTNFTGGKRVLSLRIYICICSMCYVHNSDPRLKDVVGMFKFEKISADKKVTIDYGATHLVITGNCNRLLNFCSIFFLRASI